MTFESASTGSMSLTSLAGTPTYGFDWAADDASAGSARWTAATIEALTDGFENLGIRRPRVRTADWRLDFSASDVGLVAVSRMNVRGVVRGVRVRGVSKIRIEADPVL
jgi:hypothetical protein